MCFSRRKWNFLKSRMHCVKSGWNWLSNSGEEDFLYFHILEKKIFYIFTTSHHLPLEKGGVLHLNLLHPRMLFAKLSDAGHTPIFEDLPFEEFEESLKQFEPSFLLLFEDLPVFYLRMFKSLSCELFEDLPCVLFMDLPCENAVSLDWSFFTNSVLMLLISRLALSGKSVILSLHSSGIYL